MKLVLVTSLMLVIYSLFAFTTVRAAGPGICSGGSCNGEECEVSACAAGGGTCNVDTCEGGDGDGNACAPTACEAGGGACLLPTDTDSDGVTDGSDYCPSTSIPENVPTRRLLKLRFALVDGDGTFDTKVTGGRGGPDRSYTIEDTAGCSCEQILDAQGLGEDEGQLMFGCAIGVMDTWVEFVNP